MVPVPSRSGIAEDPPCLLEEVVDVACAGVPLSSGNVIALASEGLDGACLVVDLLEVGDGLVEGGSKPFLFPLHGANDVFFGLSRGFLVELGHSQQEG